MPCRNLEKIWMSEIEGLYLEREGNIYFCQPEGKDERATVYTGYCFQVDREKMCSCFLFLHKHDTQGHPVVRMGCL